MQEEDKIKKQNTVNKEDVESFDIDDESKKHDSNNEEVMAELAEQWNDEVMTEFVELGDDGEEMDSNSTVKKLREKVKKLEAEKAEYLNSWQRALADYKNREMSIAKERPEWGKMAVRDFAEDLLIVLDTYDAAKSNVAVWEAVDANWRAGIEYIFNTFESKLKDQGFEKFGAVGDEFDPNIHEGLGTVPTVAVVSSFAETKGTESKSPEDANANKENTIAQLIMSGYKYNGKVIRPAKVKVYN